MKKLNINSLGKYKELIKELNDVYPILHDDNGIVFELQENKNFSVEYANGKASIGFTSISELLEGVGLVLGCAEDSLSVKNKGKVKTLSYMLDCSRNSVLKKEYVKKLIRLISVLGFNALLLYTEDTYTIDEEPYFGYFRGRYTKEELKEIDEYGLKFGVELIPHIQTLAHLNALTKHKAYYATGTFDRDDILLVGEERTYQLIERMMKTTRECFHSDRIHIGMDEAFHLGRGRYLDKNGYVSRTKIMIDHLNRVVEICNKYNYEPMIYSDMFFKDYYDVDEMPREEAVNNVPKQIKIIFWDYWRHTKEQFIKHFNRHKVIGNPIGFAGGAIKWIGFTPANEFSILPLEEALEACVEEDIDYFTITGWGDNGGETSTFTIIPSLYAIGRANRGLNKNKDDFKNLFQIEWDDFMKIDLASFLGNKEEKMAYSTQSRMLLYCDPLLGAYDSAVREEYSQIYESYEKQLLEVKEKVGPYAYLFETQYALCKVLKNKSTLGLRLRKAYQNKDNKKLRELAKDIQTTIDDLNYFYEIFKKQWMIENKPHGFDVQDLRIGGLLLRLKHVKEVVEAYLNNKVQDIPELKDKLLDYYGNVDQFKYSEEVFEPWVLSFESINVNW